MGFQYHLKKTRHQALSKKKEKQESQSGETQKKNREAENGISERAWRVKG